MKMLPLFCTSDLTFALRVNTKHSSICSQSFQWNCLRDCEVWKILTFWVRLEFSKGGFGLFYSIFLDCLSAQHRAPRSSQHPAFVALRCPINTHSSLWGQWEHHSPPSAAVPHGRDRVKTKSGLSQAFVSLQTWLLCMTVAKVANLDTPELGIISWLYEILFNILLCEWDNNFPMRSHNIAGWGGAILHFQLSLASSVFI